MTATEAATATVTATATEAEADADVIFSGQRSVQRFTVTTRS